MGSNQPRRVGSIWLWSDEMIIKEQKTQQKKKKNPPGNVIIRSIDSSGPSCGCVTSSSGRATWVSASTWWPTRRKSATLSAKLTEIRRQRRLSCAWATASSKSMASTSPMRITNRWVGLPVGLLSFDWHEWLILWGGGAYQSGAQRDEIAGGGRGSGWVLPAAQHGHQRGDGRGPAFHEPTARGASGTSALSPRLASPRSSSSSGEPITAGFYCCHYRYIIDGNWWS